MSLVLQENLNEEYEAVRSSDQLKALIKVYFMHSGACDFLKIGMSQQLLDDVVAACNSFLQQSISTAKSKLCVSIERSTRTGREGSGSSANHHQSAQLVSLTA